MGIPIWESTPWGLLSTGPAWESVRAWGKGVFTWELASRPLQVCPVLGGFSFRTSVL